MKLYINEDGAYSINPPGQDWIEYEHLETRIFLKQDLGWKEVKDFQKLMAKADLWDDFPSVGYTLISAEEQPGDELQWVDLLYLRNDGALMPCELKIGGHNLDTVGQLLRYISDLNFQNFSKSDLNGKNDAYLNKIINQTTRKILKEKFQNFLSRIEEKYIRVLPKSGIIIDENFKPQILKAIRYLNDECGFSIKPIQVEAYTEMAWKKMDKYKIRVDFKELS